VNFLVFSIFTCSIKEFGILMESCNVTLGDGKYLYYIKFGFSVSLFPLILAYLCRTLVWKWNIIFYSPLLSILNRVVVGFRLC
jgi:hypothetical protein